VPHVASESNTQVQKSYRAQNERPSFSADRAASTPFESLIDDSLPPPAKPNARPADDRPRAERSERNQTKSADRPDRPSRSNDRSKSTDAASNAPADGDSTKSAETKGATDGDATKDTNETTSDTKTEKADAADAQSAEGEAKPADTSEAIDATVIATTVPAQTPAVVADAIAPTAAVTAENTQPADADAAIDADGAQKAQPELLNALQAKVEGKVEAKNGEKSDGKTAGKAAKPSADAAKATALTPAELEAAAKAQPAGDSDQHATVHANAKTVADTHRGVDPQTQAKTAADDSIAAPKLTVDIAQPTVPPAPTQYVQTLTATAATAPVANPQAAKPETAVPLNGVGIEIASKALSGRNQFDIRLDPPDLGRIHVRLEVDHKGNVISHMVADRSDTLDLLRRDMSNLERALQDAGLKTSDNSLQFSLRDQSANQQQGDERGSNSAHIVVDDGELAAREITARDYSRYGARAGGLDIRV